LLLLLYTPSSQDSYTIISDIGVRVIQDMIYDA
jgi:hypothetical protein